VGISVWKHKPAVIIPKSIAVLPFENLSDDSNSAYFADGIQAEILTRLARIADLKVISRTSTQRYHSKPGNLGEIANQVGVANIVEGSVQKVADQVRVSVQLINAQTDSHLWAESYDRKLTDILGVESEIAKRIAESLQAKLTGQEQQALTVRPTNNPEAYDAYLRGVSFEVQSGVTIYDYDRNLEEKAAGFYERAVQLDPNFALAWARLSRLDANLYANSQSHTPAPARGDAAKRALETAQKLDPDSPETLLALGYYRYVVLGDHEAGKTLLERVRKMWPGNSEVYMAYGRVAREDGLWDQSIAYYEQCLTLDPRNVGFLMEAAWTYAMLRRFPDALRLYDRALDILPNNPNVIAAKAGIYQAQGDLQEAAGLLSGINGQALSVSAQEVKSVQLRLERNYNETIRILQDRVAQSHFDSQLDNALTHLGLAHMQWLAGDIAGAKVTAEQGRNTLEQLSKDRPDDWVITEKLSQLCALMGDKDSALKEAQRAIALKPTAKDAVTGPGMEENMAFVQMIAGDKRQAIAIFTRLLNTPYDSRFCTTTTTPALLRLDPIWDPLRADPDFQKLCQEKQPPATP